MSDEVEIAESVGLSGVAAVGAGLLGFVIRMLWEKYSQRREKLRELRLNSRIDGLEKALKKFYWPLYHCLCKDAVAWRKNEQRSEYDLDVQQELERRIILPNHRQMLRIMRKYTYLAEPDSEFQRLALLYTKHATLYITLRESGHTELFPKDLGSPFPYEFVRLIERKTKTEQKELNELLGIKNSWNATTKELKKLMGRNSPSYTPEEDDPWYKRWATGVKDCCLAVWCCYCRKREALNYALPPRELEEGQCRGVISHDHYLQSPPESESEYMEQQTMDIPPDTYFVSDSICPTDDPQQQLQTFD